MKEYIKKNFTVLLAFLLPLALVIIVALSSYLPSLFLSTDFNFIYASCTDNNNYDYQCKNYLKKRYTVIDNKLFINPVETKENEAYTVHIFLHDTEKNESKEITEEEVKTLTINNLLTSPDGLTVSSHYDGGADFFLIYNNNSSYNYYLTKGKSKDKLNLINQDDYYYYQDNFQFIGWVLPGRN